MQTKKSWPLKAMGLGFTAVLCLGASAAYIYGGQQEEMKPAAEVSMVDDFGDWNTPVGRWERLFCTVEHHHYIDYAELDLEVFSFEPMTLRKILAASRVLEEGVTTDWGEVSGDFAYRLAR